MFLLVDLLKFIGIEDDAARYRRLNRISSGGALSLVTFCNSVVL
jgi:hypothetical protein